MEVRVVEALKSVLEPAKISFCVINEAALKYYNVPSYPITLDICVDGEFLCIAESLIGSCTDVFKWVEYPHAPFTLFEAFIDGKIVSVNVYPDTFVHLNPLENNIVQISEYPEHGIKFSKQFNYSDNITALSTIPVPRLATLIQGLTRKHFEMERFGTDYHLAGHVEQLVDGMNLDEAWCLGHLDTSRQRDLNFVMEFVKSKRLRISQFYHHNITCFVPTKQDAEELRMIPGYDEPSWAREVSTPGNKADNRPRSQQATSSWFEYVFNSLTTNLPAALHKPVNHPVAIQYMSDLHLEVGQQYTDFTVPKAAPYLVLGGDIGCLRNYDGLLDFLAAQCEQFERVFLVLGNHEFFGISRDEGIKLAKSLECEPRLLGKLSLMNRGRFDLNRRVTILGCTLQTHIPEESQLWVRMKVADFSSIKNWTVGDHNAEHLGDLKWLKKQLREISFETPKRDVIIVTHHAPSFSNTSDPKHKSNPWSSAFCTELLESEVKSWHGLGNISHWIFGHTHWNSEFRKHGMVVSSNQRGYINPASGRAASGHEPRGSWFSMLLDYFSPSSNDFLVTKTVQV
ncbi:hypothetical protein FQN54_006088 [Arachnomyces sp. PD_36]|nr:hypothetical protein FQN54_006088 [Arachnomyces sp. PD_36]